MASRARRETRILKSAEYQYCRNNGVRLFSRHFSICACELTGQSARYGMTVSRKIGNAVMRNRIKRLLREYFRFNLPLNTSWQIVVTARKDAHLLSLQGLTKELEPIMRHLEKLSAR